MNGTPFGGHILRFSGSVRVSDVWEKGGRSRSILGVRNIPTPEDGKFRPLPHPYSLACGRLFGDYEIALRLPSQRHFFPWRQHLSPKPGTLVGVRAFFVVHPGPIGDPPRNARSVLKGPRPTKYFWGSVGSDTLDSRAGG